MHSCENFPIQYAWSIVFYADVALDQTPILTRHIILWTWENLPS